MKRRLALGRPMVTLGSLAIAGLIATGCGQAGGSAAPQRGTRGHLAAATTAGTTTTTTAATTTTTTKALANCGATRDPFDPTNAPPPAGSPALC